MKDPQTAIGPPLDPSLLVRSMLHSNPYSQKIHQTLLASKERKFFNGKELNEETAAKERQMGYDKDLGKQENQWMATYCYL